MSCMSFLLLRQCSAAMKASELVMKSKMCQRTCISPQPWVRAASGPSPSGLQVFSRPLRTLHAPPECYNIW